MLRYTPGFRLGNGIEAQEVLSGQVTRADIQPGTIIEAIALDTTFDKLVVALGKLTLSDSGLTPEEITMALSPLYQPVTQKPTIAKKFADAAPEFEGVIYTRALIVVPPYKPPISDDNGYVRYRTISAWAVKFNREEDEMQSVTGLACTIYQPARHGRTCSLLKTLGAVETMAGEYELIGRLQSNRKVLR
jgi:hypothetical protein